MRLTSVAARSPQGASTECTWSLRSRRLLLCRAARETSDGESLNRCQEFPDESSCWPLQAGRLGGERAGRCQRTSSWLPLTSNSGGNFPGPDAELEVHLYFVARLEPPEDRRRRLDAEVRHLDGDHSGGFDGAVGHPRRGDVHLDLVLLSGDGQGADGVKRKAVLCFTRHCLEGRH